MCHDYSDCKSIETPSIYIPVKLDYSFSESSSQIRKLGPSRFNADPHLTNPHVHIHPLFCRLNHKRSYFHSIAPCAGFIHLHSPREGPCTPFSELYHPGIQPPHYFLNTVCIAWTSIFGRPFARFRPPHPANMRTINPLNMFTPRTGSAARSRNSRQSSKETSSLRPEPAINTTEEQDQSKNIPPSEKAGGHSCEGSLAEQVSEPEHETMDEKSPLLGQASLSVHGNTSQPPVLKRIASAIVGSFRVVVSAVLAPGQWLIACFYDDQGHFSMAMPFRRIGPNLAPRKRQNGKKVTSEPPKQLKQSGAFKTSQAALFNAAAQDSSALTSESEPDSDVAEQLAVGDSPARNTRSRATSASVNASDAPKKSIKIKGVTQDELRRRKRERAQDLAKSRGSTEPPLTVATIKSPTSATSTLRLTRYPKAPAPPRPLIPRRHPSYSNIYPPATSSQKTLVIDLDETLIHSMAKGGRMSTGHMVEVKLSSPVGLGNSVIAPQVPILYYVHKRPHCDEFLRKISKWYNLIVFTASVQEYADPVIDWLELERKYFSARYYRQHCTYRNGAYIKDLSQVEPDLSKVMILDNSPISYIFHEGMMMSRYVY